MKRHHLIAFLSLAACAGTDPKEGSEQSTPDDDVETGPRDGDETGEDGGDSAGGGDAVDAVVPVEAGGRWTFTSGELTLVVDPTRGARISRFALGPVELLTDASVDSSNWGATFWPSPQSAWSWPPPPAIDDEPYTAALDGATLTLTSAPAQVGTATLVVEKRVTVTDVATIEYTVRNEGTAEASVAGWQIARVDPGGLTFFPSGTYVNPTLGALTYTDDGAHVWTADAPAADAKVLADATGGWIAHAANGVLLVQRFPDVRLGDAAPGDAEVEIFANGGGGYREVEVQSAYTTLAPGEALTWTVTWEAHTIPSDVPVDAGSAELVELAGG